MALVDARTWLEHLSQADCWRLLAQTPVGRVGVIVDSAPEIYPVNYVVDNQTIVFRTEPGSKLRGIDRSPSVCFQIDGVDTDDKTGWSVLVKGRAIEVDTVDELRHLRELPLHYWCAGAKDHWLRIDAREVTGRRLRPTATTSTPAADEGELSG